jgi:hypothetical protein
MYHSVWRRVEITDCFSMRSGSEPSPLQALRHHQNVRNITAFPLSWSLSSRISEKYANFTKLFAFGTRNDNFKKIWLNLIQIMLFDQYRNSLHNKYWSTRFTFKVSMEEKQLSPITSIPGSLTVLS